MISYPVWCREIVWLKTAALGIFSQARLHQRAPMLCNDISKLHKNIGGVTRKCYHINTPRVKRRREKIKFSERFFLSCSSVCSVAVYCYVYLAIQLLGLQIGLCYDKVELSWVTKILSQNVSLLLMNKMKFGKSELKTRLGSNSGLRLKLRTKCFGSAND